ncbi:hypothetical protein BSKO_11716 [Bryopsis sp. KO-2023]|nr:hypothetical protein BSKO_11716 [Bryopsis sp. KO-2023]
MPITHDDLPFVSPQLVAGFTKRGSDIGRTHLACRPKRNLLYPGPSSDKTVDVKPNPEGDGVVFMTTTNGFAPKDSIVEETKEGSSLKEYQGFVETVCKAAGREDLIGFVSSKVGKLVKSELEE